jgi:hypothetical protein
MTGRIIQGFFPSGRAKLLTPLVQPKPKAYKPGSPGPGFAQHVPVAQPYGGNDTFQIDPTVLGLASGGGRPLPDAVRSKMETAFGADFSAVRVHVGPQAERIGALAFTTGTDIYFAPGRYQPDSTHGQQLLGHELAHVVQQRQGRVRSSGSGIAVVQDRALEAEADRLGHRAAAAQAKPLGAALQPKAPARISAPGANRSGYSQMQAPMGGVNVGAAQRQVAGSRGRTLQARGGSAMLAALAQPKVFAGPAVEVQKRIVDMLEDVVRGDGFPSPLGNPLGLFCLGGIELPENMNVDLETLIRNARLTNIALPAVRNCYSFIERNEELKSLIVRNTLHTMSTAGQLRYLETSGLTAGEWKILVEIHYYRDRQQNMPNLHKDTLGETIFVNLNYVTDREIAGPEYVVNPLTVPAHQEQINALLPPKFLKHLANARTTLGRPTEIEASTIPANGVVTFVDELIHHATPLYRRRQGSVPAANFAKFLKDKFPTKYDKAVAAYEKFQKSGYAYAGLAWATSWTFSFLFTSVAESLKWYRWIGMTKSTSMFSRVQLAASGIPAGLLDELTTEYSEFGIGFQQVSIPSARRGEASLKGPIRPPEAPRLTRQMSSMAIRRELPAEPSGQRRFFRTWVRAVRRTA